MKAIRIHEFGAPEVLRLEEVPEPQPGPGQVLVKVHAVGVNPYEGYMRAGAYAAPPLPFTPGHDAAGVVEAVGAGVKAVAPGDRVYTSQTLTGAYAEKTLCLESRVHPLPERVSFAQGAGVSVPYAAAYRALFQRARAMAGEVRPGPRRQRRRRGGRDPVGPGRRPDRHRHRRHRRRAPPGRRARGPLRPGPSARKVILQEVMQITENRGVDVICELLANVNLGRDLEVLANGGRVVVIGSRGTVTIDPRLT